MFPDVPKMALTATAGMTTRKDIIKSLKLNNAKVFISSFDRPNIHYTIQKKGSKDQNYSRLLNFIEDNYPNDVGIVYCLSRKKTEEVSSFLKSRGLDAHAYHAGMTPLQRDRAQDKFLNQEGVIICATVAFGMGIDRSNVRYVAHMDLPKCLESYYQETGRAGRDGLPSKTWLLYGMQDLVLLKKITGKGVSPARKRAAEEKLDAMLGICETLKCRREVLLNYFNDVYSGPCDNCDNCQSTELMQVDVTELAIKALRCVYESGQKYNIQYMVDILTQTSTSSISKNNLHLFNMFNNGINTDPSTWFSLYRQLVACGVLKTQMNGNSKLELTAKALPILNGSEKFFLKSDRKKVLLKAQTKKNKIVVPKKPITKKPNLSTGFGQGNQSDVLFNNLKDFRRELARKKRTKAFKIFPDRTLWEMSQAMPRDLDELESIYGVGPKKIKKYGKIFLDALQELSF